jgi:hypothetical protein
LKFKDLKFNPKATEARLIFAFQELLRAASNDEREERNLSLNQMRAELYKLYYHDSLFDLNLKGDAAELLSTLLKMMHACFINP